MSKFSSSVMLALLPTTTEWCKIELPHLTLVYAGETEDLSQMEHNELAKVALELALTCPQLTLDVVTTDLFGGGDEPDVDVLLLRPSPQLFAMRSVVESWNVSKHPFRPHVTVGPQGSLPSDIPTQLTFDRIMVGWGDTHLTYSLKG